MPLLNRLALGACCLVLCDVLLGQSTAVSEVQFCGMHQMQDRLFELHPEARMQAEQAKRLLEFQTEQGILAGQREDLLIIPVVFHVIHNNGPENISDAQIYDAVDVLNATLRAMDSQVSDVIPEFEDLVADIEIEFRLAQKAPNGDCHSGINRIVSELTYEGDSDMKALIQWPRNKYMNVWVCAEAAGAAGYTLLPSSVQGQWAALDGIVLQHSYCGSIGTSNLFRSRTLTHEVGHWLNLEHTWGPSNTPALQSNCNEDDNVSDTPETIGWQSCNLAGSTCGSLDNVQNYMDYSYCSRMFTEGQKTRMRTAALSSIAQRNQLSQASNLQATGVAGPDILCEAKFDLDRDVVCIGDGIQFTDESFHGPTSWTWDFGDGTSSTEQSPFHTYTQPGTYDVSLTIGNGSQQVSSTVDQAVVVLQAGAMQLPMNQSFESWEYPSNQWFVENPGDDEAWEITENAAATGSRSLKLNNHSNNIEFNEDFLRTATMDMTGADEIRISYKWAFTHRSLSTETDDRLRVSVTRDCGGDWDLRKMHRGFTDLPSADPTPYPFTPSDADEWNSNTIVLTQDVYKTPNFRVQFEFQSQLGNNIYLDDINVVKVGGPVDVAEAQAETESWTLAPNPSVSSSSVFFTSAQTGWSTLEVLDASGRRLSLDRQLVEAGTHEWPLELQLSQGVYLVRLQTAGNIQRTWRLVVQ